MLRFKLLHSAVRYGISANDAALRECKLQVAAVLAADVVGYSAVMETED